MVTRFPSASVTLETARAVPPPRDEEEAEADEEDDTDPKPRALALLEDLVPDAFARTPCSALRRAASEALSAIMRPPSVIRKASQAAVAASLAPAPDMVTARAKAAIVLRVSTFCLPVPGRGAARR
jgi:hypothetical protein